MGETNLDRIAVIHLASLWDIFSMVFILRPGEKLSGGPDDGDGCGGTCC